ncbi:MAG: prenyltransferase/squalene oxidase repeat-containing protein [Chthoniobacteraceae bacterium]
MKTSPLPGRVLLLLLGFFSVAVRADDPAPLRDAITRGLGFLAREGDEWMNKKDCNSCHHLPELIWSHREAERRGFEIDPAMLAEFIAWADERSRKAKKADEMTAFMKLAMPDKPAPELAKLIVDGQQPDGSWKIGGQFATMQRREVPEATENSARLFILALATQDSAAADAAREKAAALLAKSGPAKSIETLVFRALYARRFGSREEADALRAEILAHQHEDGGWSWMIAEPQSDPLATGQVLYLLHQSPDASTAEATARARDWLLKAQREDGGWPIDITRISKIDRSAPAKAKSFKEATDIYIYWGSAWATLGLLHGVPVVAD